MTGVISRRVRSTLLGYALLAPSLFGVACFLLLPMLVVVWLSLHRWDLLGPIRYAGLDNWRSVLADETFGNSLLVTLIFIAIVVPAQIVLGLAAAALLARGLPGTGVFRTLYVVPWVCSPLAVAVLWHWILAPTDGAVSTLLGRRIEWLTDPGLALPVVSAVTVWTNVGYVTLFFLAGILAIPPQIQAAARLDGATGWQRFWKVTFPLLRPVSAITLLLGLVYTLKVFDIIWIMTKGGPSDASTTLATWSYRLGFGTLLPSFGPGAAVGNLLILTALVFGLVYIRVQRRQGAA